METAGKSVENEELRDALKENGIGRPSTRAAIIETLFKRNYIRKERKTLVATPTGVELITTIQEELLKSAELTGIWEKKLRQIERGTYEARTFLDELKQMVSGIVQNVKRETGFRITVTETPKTPTTSGTAKEPAKKGGRKTAAASGETGEKERKPRKPRTKKTGKQPEVTPETTNGNPDASNQADTRNNGTPAGTAPTVPEAPAPRPEQPAARPVCPVCNKGTILKGRTAYGCSEYKTGCMFRLPFETYGSNLSDAELAEVIRNLPPA